jgi:hypothetical protein
MKAYKHIIQYALSKGFAVSVWDGEEWQVKRSNKFKEITDAVESVEEAALRIRAADGQTVANSVSVSSFGLEDDETVTDYTVCPFMDEWETAYNAATN